MRRTLRHQSRWRLRQTLQGKSIGRCYGILHSYGGARSEWGGVTAIHQRESQQSTTSSTVQWHANKERTEATYESQGLQDALNYTKIIERLSGAERRLWKAASVIQPPLRWIDNRNSTRPKNWRDRVSNPYPFVGANQSRHVIMP